MPYVILDYRDGGYSVKPLTDDEADRLMRQGHEVVLVEDRVLTAMPSFRVNHRGTRKKLASTRKKPAAKRGASKARRKR